MKAPLLACVLLAAVNAGASTPPDWALAALKADTGSWSPGPGRAALLNYDRVTFLPPDGRRLILTTRGVARRVGSLPIPAGIDYDLNTDKVIEAKAWVISPDGRRARAIPSDAFVDRPIQQGSLFWNSRRECSFLGFPQEGGSLAWEFKVTSDHGIPEASMELAPGYPVLRSVFEVIPMARGSIQWSSAGTRLAPPSSIADSGLRWSEDNVGAEPADRPPGFLPNKQIVRVRLKAAQGVPWDSWDQISHFASAVIEPEIQVDPDIRNEAARLTAGKNGRWERIRALAHFVQSEIAYLEVDLARDSLHGYRPHPAGEVLRTRYGDCKDKATLLIALLRASGETGLPVLLTAQNPAAVLSDWPSAFFNHCIVAIPADSATPASWPVVDAGPLGHYVIFDPTDPVTPLGVLAFPDQGGGGLLVAGAGGLLVSLPVSDSTNSRIDTATRIQLAGDGSIDASIDIRSRGLDAALAYGIRHRMTSEQSRDSWEKFVHEEAPRAESLACTDRWDDEAPSYDECISYSASNFAQVVAGGLIVVPAKVFLKPAILPPWTVGKEDRVWLGPEAANFEIQIALPAGASIEEMPDAWSQKDEFISLEINCVAKAGTVVIHAHTARKAGFYRQAQYEKLRDALKSYREAVSDPILLLPAPTH